MNFDQFYCWRGQTYAIVPQLPEVYRNELPSPEAIADRLRLWDENVGDE